MARLSRGLGTSQGGGGTARLRGVQEMPAYQSPQQQISGMRPMYQPPPQISQQTTAPQTTSTQTTYTQSPAPVRDPFGEQRYAGMMAAALKADPYAAQRGGYLKQLQQMSQPGAKFAPTDPSYAFRFKEGQGALESSLAARGLLGAGRAGLELQQYGQEAASQEFQSQFQRLQELAGMGDPTGAARLEQEAVEGRYRTYQPQMMEAGRTVTESGGMRTDTQTRAPEFMDGGMMDGGAGGGGGYGERRGLETGSGGGYSEYAAVLANLATGPETSQRYGATQKTLAAARARDIARGLDDPAPSGVWGSGVLEGGASVAAASGSGGGRGEAPPSTGTSTSSSRRAPYDPMARFNRIQLLMKTGGKEGVRIGG